MIFRQIPEVKVHVYGQISGQKYEFPAFTGKITHAHTVCTRPFLLLLLKGPGYEARAIYDRGLGTRLFILYLASIIIL